MFALSSLIISTMNGPRLSGSGVYCMPRKVKTKYRPQQSAVHSTALVLSIQSKWLSKGFSSRCLVQPQRSSVSRAVTQLHVSSSSYFNLVNFLALSFVA